MKMVLWAVIALTLAALAAARGEPVAVADEYVTVFTDAATSEEISAHMGLVAASGSRVLFEYNFGAFRGYSMRAPAGSAIEAADFAFLRRAEVAFVEPNKIYRANAPVLPRQPPQPPANRTFAAECKLQEQATWGLVRTAEQALYIDGLYPWSSAFSGAGVSVYVIDTGIYTEHSDFGRRAVWGFDAVDDPSPETDLNGHGTHCAGTAISTTYGIAKQATAVAVRVLNADGEGTNAGVIAGVQFVARDATGKRAVASMSLGGPYSSALNKAVQAATSLNIPFVVAAGNEAQDACDVSPASEPSAITVMCSDSQDKFCYFSNFGSCADIIAPGMGITSTWINGPFSDNTISGTSMSTPHVAGVVAKLLSGDPAVKTPAQVRAALNNLAGKGYIREVPTKEATANALLYYPCS